jgi:SpoVK/Ycf46/Vps4 family AAA+-type ATPase
MEPLKLYKRKTNMSGLANLKRRAEKDLLTAFLEKDKDAKKNELPIPIENLASLQSSCKPVLDAAIFEQVQAGMVSVKHADTWLKWGFKSQNSVLLLLGPAGTGKTTTARWIAKHLARPLITVAMGDVGDSDPGSTERGLRRIFDVAEKERAILFFDECDALLWDRSQAGPDSMWMLGVINCILTHIEKHGSIVILATNFPHILDKALLRRITFRIEFTEPSYETRKKLWASKWPKWPLPVTTKIIEQLAEYPINGAYIEKIIEECARFAILQESKPTYTKLKELCGKHTTEAASESKREAREA